MGYSGAGGKLIDEKNQKQKILWHCPFKDAICIQRLLLKMALNTVWCIVAVSTDNKRCNESVNLEVWKLDLIVVGMQ